VASGFNQISRSVNMPRTKLLVSALALALGGFTTAQAQTFSDVVVFGDSLSDDGNVAQLSSLPAGFGFTTNPDSVYADLVAEAFSFNLTNSLSGGTDYAVGGACAIKNSVSFTCVNDPSGPAGAFSITNQVTGYLAGHGGKADPNGLYMMWGGANDIFTATGNPATAQLVTGLAAQTMVGLISTVQNAGAKTIVVFNLPDIGLTPSFVGTPLQGTASGLAFVYNSTFNGGLATLDDGIVPINVNGLFNEIVGDPGAYGFTNVTGQACGVGSSSVACGPTGAPLPYHYAPGTNESYLFADSVHPTGAAHQMLANIVVATLTAPGQVSMAGEIPLQMYDDHSSVINNQIFNMTSAARSPGETNAYGHVQYSQTSYKSSSTTNSMDSDLFAATFGADVRYSDNISLGAAVSVGNSNGDNAGASIGGTEVLFSAYGIAHFGSGYLDMILSGGSSNLDIDRSIVLGPATRVEKGSTNATHRAVEIGAGWTFGETEALKHGPFASIAWQKVQVDGYKEESSDSTSMYFNDFRRTAAIARLGYQLRGNSGNWQPFARVAWANDSDASTTRVQTGSNSMNGHFTMDGFQAPKDWTEADVGVNYALGENKFLSFSYRGRFSDDTQDVNSVDFGFRVEF
jgi:outer membrane lipase/esterase